MKRYFFFFTLLMVFRVQAQVVTSSFDPTSMSYNPAATAKRYYGGYYTKYDKKKLEASGLETGDIPQQNLTNLNANWTVEDEIDSFRFLYSNVTNKYKIIPEVLVYKQTLETSYSRTDNTGTDSPSSATVESEITMAQFNIAHTFFDKLDVGFHFGMASVDQDQNLQLEIGGGNLTEVTATDTDIMGGSLGVTYQLPMNLYLGAFYMKYNLEQVSKGNANFGGNDQAIDINQDFEMKVLGFGLAYLIGDRDTKSMKIEISHKSTDSEISTLEKGKQTTLSFEGMTEKYYGGFSVFKLKGNSVNLQNIVDTLVSERVNSNESTLGFGIAAGFKTSAGHSFGGSASYSKATIPSKISYINTNRFDSEVKQISFSLSYSYIIF